MSKKQSIPKFQIGDRVAEKPKPRAIYAKTAATIERIKPYTAQRYGTVLDTVYQSNKGKASVPYLKISGMVLRHQLPMHNAAFV